jgi:hypothetical protein
MSAARKSRTLEEHLSGMKTEEVKKLCDWNDLDQGGSKKTMISRLLSAGNISKIDFAKADLEELMHMQLFAKCVADDLPSLGKRSELQRTLHEHFHGKDDRASKKKKGKTSDLDFLRINGLNVAGGASDFAKRRKLFQFGEHDLDFDEMGIAKLNAFADLYGAAPSDSRKLVLESLKSRFSAWKGAPDGSKDDFSGPIREPRLSKSVESPIDLSQHDSQVMLYHEPRTSAMATEAHIDGHGAGGGNLQTQALIAIMEHLNNSNLSAQAKAAKKEQQAEKPPTSDKDGKALAAYLAKLAPHLVPLVYEGNPEVLGLHIARSIDFCSELDDDMAIVTLYGQIVARKKAVLECFDDRHYVAERNFCNLIIKIFGWAGSIEEKKGITDAKVKRADQARCFNSAFDKMTEQLREFGDRIELGEDFYCAQVRLCVQASIGIIVSKAAIKSMEVASSWRESLEKKFGAKSVVNLATREVRAAPPSHASPRDVASAKPIQQRGLGGTPLGRDKKQQWGSVSGPPDPSSNAKLVGLAMICSQSVAGSNTKGMRAKGKGTNCDVCKGDHFAFECPRAFGETYPGRAMPGWTEKGERIEACWNGAEITERTLQQWQRMQRQGWFCKHPFGEGGRQCPPFSFV